MKIKPEDIKKIGALSWDNFKNKFERNGLNKSKLTQEQYVDLVELYTALMAGDTTAEEYLENEVDGTWIPTTEGVEKLI